MRQLSRVLIVCSLSLFSLSTFANECFSTNPDGLPLSCSSLDSDWVNRSCRIQCLEDQTPICTSPVLTDDGTICGNLTPAFCYCVAESFN